MASESPPEIDMDPIRLTGAQETLLITLYGRWQDFYSPRPLLADRWSADVMAQILDKAAETRHRMRGVLSGLPFIVLRARLLDQWAADFLANNERATVVHLACGLDTRALRLRDKCGDGVTWIDVDFPDVIDLRRRIEIPEPASKTDGYTYEMLASSVVEPEWLAKLPTGNPTLVIFEGLTMYLSPEDGQLLIKRLMDRFGSGQMIFDSMPRSARFLLNAFLWLRGHWNFTFNWAIDDPRTLRELHPGLELLTLVGMWDMPGHEHLAWWLRLSAFVASWIPILRSPMQLTRFQF
ncbi:Tetracenomycin polyketide synthesis O-methyltransferase TcmP [Metarhizium anisopliae]